ncbi:MAG: hypothetical protein CMJ94_05010 [Planctomycetes bacterium]|nr:hypothetical protein [Planctomycetota bacterium]
MALFQKAPSTPDDMEASRPLEIEPGVVANMDEDEWYAKAYRGDSVPQLTVRAVVMGSILGFVLAFTNLYIGLKTGWHLGVAITACILSFSIWRMLLSAKLVKTQMTILENNCMQSTASAAGYSTGGTFVSAIAALLMMSATPDNDMLGEHLPWHVLVLWTFFLAVLGVTLAIPMKRNMINQEKLKFPSGLAAASTLQSLYADAAEATRKAKVLAYAAIFGAIWPPLIDLKVRVVDGARTTLIGGTQKLFDFLPGAGINRDSGAAFKPSDWTIKWDMNPVMIGAGMLVGLRVSLSMLAAAIALAYVIGPAAYEIAWTGPDGDTLYAVSSPGRAWREIGLWLGAPIMVASGLLSFALQWKTIVRAFSGFKGGGEGSAQDGVEVPGSWFLWGAILSGAGVVWIAHLYFGVPILLGALAVALTFVLALVACRATGESDITPTGAMGKIMQITYGVLIPQNATANLMTAGITSGAASSSADLLNDLKSGYLLGANPRRQFIAQFLGIFSGTVATVIGFKLLIPDATAMMPVTLADGTVQQPDFPAPAAVAWKAVADLFSSEHGINGMHPSHRIAIWWGLGIGAFLVLAEKFMPKEKRKYIPSATGLGLGLILPFYYPLSMTVGAVAARLWEKKDQKSHDDFMVPTSAGIIAGVSIIGVIVAVLNVILFAD